MSSNPYENEPGYEQANSKSDLQLQKHYVQKIRHETLRVAVIQPLEQYLCIAPDGTPFQGSICRADSPQTAGSDVDMTSSEESSLLGGALAEEAGSPYVEFVPFTDLVKRRFLWHYNSYLLTIDKAKEEVKDNHGFEIMPFEDRSNGMFGKFNYTDLEKRLRNIKQALDAETMRWGVEGKASYAGETGIAANLARQFAAAKAECKQRSDVTIDLQLVDDNPFVWEVTYFGRPMTNLDGGLFRILVHISPRFPDEQPRIKFATPIFHHRITKDGTPCYVASKPDEIKSHISSVIQSLEDESPPFDPRTSVINPEAGAMYWGGPEERKKYNRLLRRAVQRSTEEF
jgi:ubiquitin-conjugating enzyme E2 Z